MSNRIKIYTVHIQPEIPMAGESAIFIREGFNWWAAIFTFLWAFYHRLWMPALLLLACNALLLTVDRMGVMSQVSLMIIQLAYQVVVGFQANDWWRNGLMRRGYITHDVASGTSKMQAEQRYLERYLPSTQ